MAQPQAHLHPAFTVKFALEEAVPTFTTKDGSNILVKVNQGTGKTLDPQYPFDVTFDHGHDDIFTSADGTYSNLDCRVYGQTSGGGRFVFNYGGVMRVEGTVADILANKASSMDYKDGYVTANINISVDQAAEKEIGWVKRHNLVGRGKFSRDEGGKLFIEYTVHVVA